MPASTSTASTGQSLAFRLLLLLAGLVLFRSADAALFVIGGIAMFGWLASRVWRDGTHATSDPPGVRLGWLAVDIMTATVWLTAGNDRLMNELREAEEPPASIVEQGAGALVRSILVIAAFWGLGKLSAWWRGLPDPVD